MTYEGFEAGGVKRARRRFEHGGGWGPWDRCTVGGIFGLGGGIISVVLGSALTAVTWFTGAAGAGAYVRAAGTALLLVTIPLLAFGAHCLDLKDRRKSRG